MFRKTGKSTTEAEQTVEKLNGKGRPTPTRKEAEAAAKARVKASLDTKAAKKLLRDKRADQNRKMREGMRRGDDKFLPPRDQGPVRRYIRDWIDSRISFTEFILPLLVIIMVLQYSGNKQLVSFGSGLWTASIFLVVLDLFWMNFRLKRDLKKKFPEESMRGTFFYALLRSLQLRFMRMPKARVKYGDRPS